MSEQRWVSFPAVTEASEGRITLGHTGLPVGLDQEQLQINIAALKRGVIDFGGYDNMTLSAYAGDTDQHTYIAQSGDSDGTGTAAFEVSVSRAEAAHAQSTDDRWLNRMDVRNGSLDVRWNSAALDQRLELHERFESIKQAVQLDKVIRNQAIRGLVRHNVHEVAAAKQGPILLLEGGFDAMTIGNCIMDYSSGEYSSIATAITVRLLIQLVGVPALKAYQYGVAYRDNIEDPVFFAIRPFRLAAATGVLATSKLVRAVA